MGASSRSPRPRTAAFGRWSEPRWCRCRSVQADRGSPRTALRAEPRLGARSSPRGPLFAGERDGEALDVEREPDRRQRTAERLKQLVVAAAGADRHPEGGVVDLEHRAGVVADVADQAEVEDHARRDLGSDEAVDLAHAAERIVQTAGEAVE